MLTTEATQISQVTNGITTVFSFSFKILAQTDLVVTRTDANGIVTPGVLNTDYTVIFDSVAQTGSVTWSVAPPTGSCLIKRVSDNTQGSTLPREGPMPSATVEKALDKCTALIQETQAALLLSTSAMVGTLAQLTTIAAQNPTIPFLAIVTDSRTIQVYLGNTALGAGGFAPIGGF